MKLFKPTLKVLGTLIAEEDSVLADITSSGSTLAHLRSRRPFF
jgi:hypothetical protein